MIPALAKDLLHLACTVWAHDDAKIQCSELVTEQPLLSTVPSYERFENVRLSSEEQLPAEQLMFLAQLRTFLSIKGSARLALQREPTASRKFRNFCFQAKTTSDQRIPLVSQQLNL